MRVVGLSPRVRGNQRSTGGTYLSHGSIPACAGEPVSIVNTWGIHEVYPRVCGGTFLILEPLRVLAGLSPRVRGNHGVAVMGGIKGGSIPACAGEPRRILEHLEFRTVYPRVCGGTGTRTGYGAFVEGLSPRVRGNRSSDTSMTRSRGSIPACAGEPLLLAVRKSATEVYPRVCGGTFPCQSARGSVPGLSPRVRGNPFDPQVLENLPGSIPACAGEPRFRPPLIARLRVYPRVCGGTGTAETSAKTMCGLSPRVRGNLVQLGQGVLLARSIPACAGEPSPY